MVPELAACCDTQSADVGPSTSRRQGIRQARRTFNSVPDLLALPTAAAAVTAAVHVAAAWLGALGIALERGA
jgi:hypothetical protein